MSENTLKELEAAAKSASVNSYSPYSGFAVGAAVLTEDGRVFTGTNVENASFGLSNCAERTAIFKAVADGARAIKLVVVYTPTSEPTTPCGACRQVIREFGPDATCVCTCDSGQRIETTLQDLLPDSFGPENL
jgi:cytidine deaminase